MTELFCVFYLPIHVEIFSIFFLVFPSQMVPIKEMTDVLKVIKETALLKPKQWVRLKRGIFKDDLAQVILH